MTGPGKQSRVCIYARVSTMRQATSDLSIPDQIARGEQWCLLNGAELVDTVVEPGASATDDDRPQFQQMIARATSDERPYDIILVHSLSRLFRQAMHFLQYRTALKRAGVRIVSITQNAGDDPAGELSMSMLALFDEYTSMETAKHTQRAMLQNAKLGFWNGQTPPLGYQTYEAEKRGGKSKRKLKVDEDEAFVVRKIFDLYLSGPEGGRPLGMTKLAEWLNEHGFKYRGKKFHVSNIQAVLRNTAYIGVAFYNKRDSKNNVLRPQEEWIPIPVPRIIAEEDFDHTQRKLIENRPAARPARVTTTNNLLIGVVTCGCGGDGCGGGMSTATGKGGRYKYYACSNRLRAGPSICRGRRIPMAKLDDIVLAALEARLLQPERLEALLAEWLDHTSEAENSRREKLRQLRARQTSLEAGLERLLDLVAEGLLTASDKRFARKNAEQKAQLAQVEADIALLERQLANSEKKITPELIERFAEILRKGLRKGETALRQYYVRSLVGQVEVGDSEIRVSGSTKALEHAVARTDSTAKAGVPIIERKWRARQDSNLWPPD